MLHRDALEETCCERLPADFAWRRPIGCRPNDPTPAYPKARTPSGEARQLQNRPFVHGAHCSFIGRIGASMGRIVRSSDVLGGRMALYLPGDIMPSPVLVKPLWRRSAAGMLLYIPFRCHGRGGPCTLTDTPTDDIQQFSRSLLAKALRRVPYARKEAYERGW